MTSGINLRSTKQVREFLTGNLRIDGDSLRKLNLDEISSWVNNAPKKSSLDMLVKTLKNR